MALWNFNMEVNGKIIKCAVSWKQLALEPNGWKFGTHSPRNSTCRVLFGSDHLSSVWGDSVHFAKFPMLTFSKGYYSRSFHPISTKPHRKHVYSGKIQGITYSSYLPKFKSTWRFEDKLPQLHCRYITSIHKLTWFLLAKGQAERQGPWASCIKPIPK